jgi:chitodextrinase
VSQGHSTTTSFTVISLSAASTYSMTVKARDKAGNLSPFSDIKQVTTMAPVTPMLSGERK